MTLTLPPALESALAARAETRGVEPAALALEILSRQLDVALPTATPRYSEWMQGLLAVSEHCGISLSDHDVSSEAIYD